MAVENVGYAAHDGRGQMCEWRYKVRDPLENELLLAVLYCGVCHSDIHTARDEWTGTTYPVVPGHEFIGRVERVGAKAAADWQVGAMAGVGCLVGSCRSCNECRAHHENMCAKCVGTFDDEQEGEATYGGYGKYVVVPSDFAIRIPANLDVARGAPLLCAGITTYSPLMRCNVTKGGLRIAVAGLGGLGHMAVQWASKLGNNEVFVFSRSDAKAELAKQLGAKGLIKLADLRKHESEFDIVLDTVSAANKPLKDYFAALRPYGTLITVGLPPVDDDMQFPAMNLITKNLVIMGSNIGGIRETQEMVDTAAKLGIYPLIESITADQLNDAHNRVTAGDVRFRFVIDVAKSYP